MDGHMSQGDVVGEESVVHPGPLLDGLVQQVSADGLMHQPGGDLHSVVEGSSSVVAAQAEGSEIQVFYLDNLDFGPISAIHAVLPRMAIYTESYITNLIRADLNSSATSLMTLFGKRRDQKYLCYSHAWCINQSSEAEKAAVYPHVPELFVAYSNERFQVIMNVFDQVRTKMGGSYEKVSFGAAREIRSRYMGAFPHYVPSADENSLSVFRKRR
ncbi:hypothetical protein ACP4OV_026329 [Aristida adscensionis]